MTRCDKGTYGFPRFSIGDKVRFDYIVDSKEVILEGVICIVDACGTFSQDEEPSYDIHVDNFPLFDDGCFIKHIRESDCYVD